MSIGLVTVAFHDTYRADLQGWVDAVDQLQRQPDHVVIVTDAFTYEIVYALDTLRPKVTIVTSKPDYLHHPQVLVNQGIAHLNTEWVCKMDVDDRIYPHALNRVEATTADVYMFGIRLTVNDEHRGDMFANVTTSDNIRTSNDNLVFSGSPFRRWVWEANPYRDMIFEDWAFWIEAAKAGAEFTQSGNIDYEYRLHDHNITNNIDEQAWKNIVEAIRD